MVRIEILLEEKKISRINELELDRYVNFFSLSSKDNLNHCKAVLQSFPRWSIISGYYAMHDITKLLIAQIYHFKIEYEVHATTIKVLDQLIKNKDILKLLKKGYSEFTFLANDLAEAKKERVKTQYYTGTAFMKEEYKKRADEFLTHVVEPYISKITKLLK